MSYKEIKNSISTIASADWNEMASQVIQTSGCFFSHSSNSDLHFPSSQLTNWLDNVYQVSGTGGGSIVDKIGITLDGGGDVIPSGVKGDSYVPYNCTIQSVYIFGTPSGSIYIDIWKDTSENYPPTIADTITGDKIVTLSSNSQIGIISSNTTLPNWTTTITDGDILRYYVSSCNTLTRCTLTMRVLRT